MKTRNSNPDELPSIALEGWQRNPAFFDDSIFHLHPKDKRFAARMREARSNAAALRFAGAVSLAAKLSACNRIKPCLQGGCRVCGTGRQRLFGLEAQKAFGKHGAAMLTIIPSELLWQPGSLTVFNADLFRHNLCDALDAANLSSLPFIGGLDLNFSVNTGALRREFWQPHWHAFVDARFKDEVSKRLRAVFPSSTYIDPAVLGKPITRTLVFALYYGLKPVFFERKQFIRENGSRMKAEHKKILRGHPRHIELIQFLCRLGFDNRIFNNAER